MAGEVHPVPFRTRKLSPLAPMVLRSKSVGEQDVADQRGAFAVSAASAAKAPSGDPEGAFLRLGALARGAGAGLPAGPSY